MQGTKLPRAKLWIAGVSTLAILMGCEAQPVKQEAANGAEYKYPSESKAKSGEVVTQDQAMRQEGAALGQAAPAATPEAEPYGEIAQAQVAPQAAQAPGHSAPMEIDITQGADYSAQPI